MLFSVDWRHHVTLAVAYVWKDVMLYIVLCRTKWRVHTLVCRCEMINFMSYVHLPRIQMTNMCTHEMFPWQFDKRQKNSYLRQTENVWALGRIYHFKVGGEGRRWSNVLTAWVEIFALKKITSSSTDSQLLSNSMRRKHVLMNGSYELYLLLFMSRLRCDILLSTCRRKNPWCQRQNICQCHEKLCFGQRKGIFILLQKNYFEQSRINGNLKIDQNKLSSQFSLHF